MPVKPSLDGAFQKSVPFTQYQYLTVTFPSTYVADADYHIPHTLSPADPDAVDYEVVRSSAACILYNDQSGTRQPWGSGYIILRSNLAAGGTAYTVDLRLSVRRT